MSIKTSTGLGAAMLITGPFRTVMNLGTLSLYAGVPPSNADAALGSAVLLVTLTNNATATGLTMDTTAAGAVLLKNPAEVWKGTNVAGGVASFYRFVAVGDDGTASATQPRVQGLVATSGADLNLSSTTLASGATQTVDFYSVAIPTPS